MAYYDLQFDDQHRPQWHISIPPILPGEEDWWDVWAFMRGAYYRGHVPVVAKEFEGPKHRTDFTTASFGAFVVSSDLGALMCGLAPEELQLVPLNINGGPTDQWFILNILSKVNCIDFKRSKVDWGHRDGRERIVSVYYLEIEEEKAAGHDIFRLGEFPVQVLVSERMAEMMRNSGCDGFKLTPLPWGVGGNF